MRCSKDGSYSRNSRECLAAVGVVLAYDYSLSV